MLLVTCTSSIPCSGRLTYIQVTEISYYCNVVGLLITFLAHDLEPLDNLWIRPHQRASLLSAVLLYARRILVASS